MKIVATVPCRNESWVAGLSIRAMLAWCDAVCVLDHCSTDETPDILSDIQREYPGRVTVINETEPVWEEMRHRQRLLDTARKIGATHVALIDCDEVVSGDLLPTIRDMVLACPPAATMQLPWLCLRDSHLQVHRSGVWGEQSASMAFVDNPALHWSSAGRGTYDHHHRPPMGRPYSAYNPVAWRKSGLMHLQFSSSLRLRAKQFWYVCSELSRWPGRETPAQVREKYSLAVYGNKDGHLTPHDLVPTPESWWEPYADLMHHYHPDAEPWQLQAARDIVAANPGMDFGGDDFGTGVLLSAMPAAK